MLAKHDAHVTNLMEAAEAAARAADALKKAASGARAMAADRLNTLTFREIEMKACRLFGARPNEIRSARNSRSVIFIRQFVMYWTVRRTSMSLPQIGRLMGHRDHTTIASGCKGYVAKRAAQGRYLRPAR